MEVAMQLYLGGEVADAPPVGRFENSSQPLFAPTDAGQLAAHYDLTISHPQIDQAEFAVFGRWLAQAAAEYGLSCALIHDGIVHEVLKRLAAGNMTIGYHLDYMALWHVPDDSYARLSFAVQDAGGRPVNLPARSRAFTDKAATHAELLRHGLGVPATVIVRPWSGERSLTARELQSLRLDVANACVFVKLANGFAGRGVQRVDRPTLDALHAALAAVRQLDRQDSILVQRGISWPALLCEDGVERPAYWRVLCCLGDLFAFWWTPQSHANGRRSYRAVSSGEMRRYRLQPLLAYAQALADLSGLDWFSTELCLSDGMEESRFNVIGADGRERPVVAIDYLNDQCDVDVQSRVPGAPPDLFVRRMATRFAEEAWRLRQSQLRPATRAYLRAG
jgi:hypothetical protein